MFFELSKIFWFIVNPVNLFYFSCVICCLSLWTRFAFVGRKVLLITITITSIISFFSIGELIFWQLENRFKQNDLERGQREEKEDKKAGKEIKAVPSLASA